MQKYLKLPKSFKSKLFIIFALLLIVGGSILLYHFNPWAQKVSLATDRQQYSYGDAITFTSTIMNTGSKSETYHFGSTCTGGLFVIDDKQVGVDKVCGSAITEVTIAPGERETYRDTYVIVKEFSGKYSELFANNKSFGEQLRLEAGNHEAHLVWQGYTSNKISFTLTE